MPFSRELYIEHDDFREDPPKKFFRLAPGREVRLRNAYLITCQRGREGRRPARSSSCAARYDPATRGGDAPDGRKVKATLHWVSAAHAVDAEVRLYDRLFTVENPGAGDADFLHAAQPASLEVARDAKLEPSLAAAPAGARFQFERLGLLLPSIRIRPPAAPVFNRTVTLKDTWAKIALRQ